MNELDRIWKEMFVESSWYYSGICLEELRKTVKSQSGYVVWWLRFESRNSRIQTCRVKCFIDPFDTCSVDTRSWSP
jgi:hypothetical protein